MHGRAVVAQWVVAAVLFVLGPLAPCARAGSPGTVASAPCDREISCFVRTGDSVEWRIVSPTRPRFVIVAVLPRVPDMVQWDDTGDIVEYQLGRGLFRSNWRSKLVPTEIMRLPERPAACDWWFNPDSSCWQFSTPRVTVNAHDVQNPGHSEFYADELWQSSRDGLHWRLVAVDTGPIDMYDCGLSQRMLTTARRKHFQTPDEVSPPLGHGLRYTEHLGYDPKGDEDDGVERQYLAIDSTGDVGVEFNTWFGDSEGLTFGPVFLIDKRTARRFAIPGTGDVTAAPSTMSGVGLREVCGLLLLQDLVNGWQLLDVRSARGSDVVPATALSAYWCPRLK